MFTSELNLLCLSDEHRLQAMGSSQEMIASILTSDYRPNGSLYRTTYGLRFHKRERQKKRFDSGLMRDIHYVN
jgi:hypothetical protein